MKKIANILLVAGAATCLLNACAEEEFTDRYLNPAKVTSTSVDQLFTGELEKANEILRIGYGRFMYHDQAVGKLAQAWGVALGSLYEGGMYQTSIWDWHIGVVTQYRVLKKEYEAAGDESLKAYELCGRAVMYHVMLQALDEFGKLPFSEVGLYPATGEMVYAHLDDTKTLYELIIDDLGAINNELPTAGAIATMSDWLNDGDMSKWRKYVNSLRLRAAIRVSGAEDYTNPDNSLKSKGEQVIKEILGDAGKHPVVTGVDDEIKVTPKGSGNGWWSSITGMDNYDQHSARNTAAHARIQRLDLNGDSLYNDADDDPRLPLLYDTVHGGSKSGKFVGINTRDEAGDVSAGITGEKGIKQYSFVNERSFRDNRRINSYVITPSEIAFYKAEAILRFSVAGDAKEEFVRGVRESVKMYAKINAESDAADPSAYRSPKVDMSYWTDDKINEFAEKLWNSDPSNKLKLVYEQLWLHCGIFNATECWNTLRRTGYPNDLYFPYVTGANVNVLLQRFIVPTSEVQRNKNMPDEDNRGAYTPGKSWWEVIFWARDLTNSSLYAGEVKTS